MFPKKDIPIGAFLRSSSVCKIVCWQDWLDEYNWLSSRVNFIRGPKMARQFCFARHNLKNDYFWTMFLLN